MKVEQFGVIVYGAVYLAGVIVAAAIVGDRAALCLALLAAGLSYVDQSLIAWHEEAPGRVLGVAMMVGWVAVLVLSVAAGLAVVI